MFKFSKRKFSVIAAFILCAFVFITVPLTIIKDNDEVNAQSNKTVLNLWQIDSFEGGKGSRTSYLKTLADEFTKTENCFINVISLSSEAAKININEGNVPDLISYGAGVDGLENLFYGKIPYQTWCRGGYCIITLEETADFSDINAENTIINVGTENLSAAAALFCGLENAETAKPTEAYLKLINGKFKYLLGTQRDIFRFRTREVQFKIKAVTEFNDLYQNISVTTNKSINSAFAEKFVKKLLSNSKNSVQIGLMFDGVNLYDDEMKEMENIVFNCKLSAPVSNNTKNEILSAVRTKDLKKLKSLCI